jgi:hypothetical protein
MNQNPILMGSVLVSLVVHKDMLVELLLLLQLDWPKKIFISEAQINHNVTNLIYYTKTFVDSHDAAVINVL